MDEKTFKAFLEEEEDKHPFLTSLKDILGVSPFDYDKEALVSSFVKTKLCGNIANVDVIEFKKDKNGNITHALVNISYPQKIYKDEEGTTKQIDTKEPREPKKILIDVRELDDFMKKAFSQPGGGM